MLHVVVLWILSRGIKLGVIVLCLLPIRWILRKKAPRVFSYLLWLTLPVNVVYRLVIYLKSSGAVLVIPLTVPMLNKKIEIAIGVRELHIGVVVYIIGTIIVMGLMLLSYFRLRRCLVGSIRLRENIYVSDRVRAPFSMGLRKARIYLPCSLKETYYAPVILHENVHIARKDLWVKHVAVAFLAVFWFQPVLWFAYFLFINDMEAACDETVLRNSEAGFREAYATALVEVSYQAGKVQGVAIGYGNGEIFERVQNVMHYKSPTPSRCFIAVIVCVVFMAGALLVSRFIPCIVKMEQKESIVEESVLTVRESADGTEEVLSDE